MKPFLKELAEKMIGSHTRLDKLTFVFPNRRAALYFQNYLSAGLTIPQWAPQLFSIEEYFKRNSDLLEPDRLTLIFRLYNIYGEVLKSEESFDRFYFWGDMLLRDFDEIDKYLVNGPQLFSDLSKIKELDETFDYLTEEQKRFLQNFWVHFEEKPSFSKEQFLRMWQHLPEVYTKFTKALRKEKLGYEGMIHREVAEKFQKGKNTETEFSSVVFAGFNALTRAEETLIASMVQRGAQIFWDADDYYVNNDVQEAGQFLRSYRDHPVLGKTFGKELPPFIRNENKTIDVTGVPQRIGQAKLVGQEVKEVLASLPGENLPVELSRTVIVLPDESMLLPLMHSLPEELQDINVTMGFPLRHTPLFSLIDLIVEMQVKRRGAAFSHREVNAILGHPYVLALGGQKASDTQDEIVAKNRVYVEISDLQLDDPIFSLIFTAVDSSNATEYLLEIIRFLGASFSDKRTFDREYAYHFHQQVTRLHAILKGSAKSPDWRGFQKLWRQIILSLRIPFYGEPLRGLQIMGVLETRNLDFDNVFFLSVNEGMLPASARQGSYVPHAIRRAYGLPTFEQQDATYAYLFYRLLQRSSRVSFYYNTEPDVVGNGELSRFVQQLLLESKLDVKRRVLHNEVHVQVGKSFEVPKSEIVLGQMEKYITEDPAVRQYRLSPSNLNDYVECSLRFYLKHIARLTEAEEVEEDVDARVFGNILHDVAHWFYEDLLSRGNNLVEPQDLTNTGEVVDKLIDRAFRKFYHLAPDAEVVYEGQLVVAKAVAKTFIDRILERDRDYAPFEIRMLEEPFGELITLDDGRKVRIGGKIDRADWKNGTVRVIDYKTGKDDLNFESVESLFSHDKGRNKAAFQTMLYAFVYVLKHGHANDRITPGLMNRKNLFGNFEFGHKMGYGQKAVKIDDARPLLLEFGTRLQGLVEEMFNPEIPFQQTADTKTCQWCPYKAYCRR
jgi:hypothetical protein